MRRLAGFERWREEGSAPENWLYGRRSLGCEVNRRQLIGPGQFWIIQRPMEHIPKDHWSRGINNHLKNDLIFQISSKHQRSHHGGGGMRTLLDFLQVFCIWSFFVVVVFWNWRVRKTPERFLWWGSLQVCIRPWAWILFNQLQVSPALREHQLLSLSGQQIACGKFSAVLRQLTDLRKAPHLHPLGLTPSARKA